jgi:hypothetical protein
MRSKTEQAGDTSGFPEAIALFLLSMYFLHMLAGTCGFKMLLPNVRW